MKKILLILAGIFVLTSCAHEKIERTVSQESKTPTVASGPKPKFLPGKTSPRKSRKTGNLKQPPNAFAPKLSPMFYNVLNSDSDFETAATLSEGFIKGAVVKFLIDNRTSPAKIYFMNGNFIEGGRTPDYVQYHYNFAQKQLNISCALEQFNDHTYFTNDIKQKHFIAGSLQKYNMVQNGQEQVFFGIQFYPQDAISDQTMLHAAKVVKEAIQFDQYAVKLVSFGSQQKTESIKADLEQLNIQATSIDKIYAGIPYIPMQLGKAFGYLRLNPKGEALDHLEPTDIPVFDELPLDLSVVSAVITTVVQDAGSHVNLKSKERHTPNMVLRDTLKIQDLEKLNNQPVQLIVENEYFEIKPSTEQVVKAEYEKKNRNKKWIKIKSGTEKELLSFDHMAALKSPAQLAESAHSYGGKASKLGLLSHARIAGLNSSIQKKMGYRLTPIGFGVPVTAYHDFVNSNPDLKSKIQVLVESEMGIKGKVPPSPKKRLEMVKEIQNLFYQTPISENLSQQIIQQLNDLKILADKTYPKSPVKKLKIRSSANAEDIPNFDGAGLHSSFGAKLKDVGNPADNCTIVVSQEGISTKEEVMPETVMCAVKAVFASLWNKRAIEERNFARIDQSSAVMGLAVNTSYDFRDKTEGINEIANAVLVTRIINTKGIYGYRLSLNTDENLVTNPTPGTQAEIVFATFLGMDEAPQLSFIQYAKTSAQLEPLNKPMLSPEIYRKMVDIARQVEYSYCRNIPGYYPLGNCQFVVSDVEKKTSLDMEFKIYSNGEVLLKQAREFSGQ